MRKFLLILEHEVLSKTHNPDGSIRINRTTKVIGKEQHYFINKFFDGSVLRNISVAVGVKKDR